MDNLITFIKITNIGFLKKNANDFLYHGFYQCRLN